jgi:hypothetical protein
LALIVANLGRFVGVFISATEDELQWLVLGGGVDGGGDE